MEFTAERCYHIADCWDNIKTDYAVWDADCWRTMGNWLMKNPDITERQWDAKWEEICMRPEGDKYKIFGGLIVLEV